MTDTDRYQLAVKAAELYERDIVPTLIRPQAELMLNHVLLHEGDRILDAACGTGIVTRVVTQQFPHIGNIVGLDLNPAMLDVARTKSPATQIPTEWQQGDLCDLPFPDNHFDMVLCQHGLQFVPDKLTALRELRRVLSLDGRLAFTVWSAPNRPHAALADALRHHVNEKAATSCLSPFAWRDTGTISDLVNSAGFISVEMSIIVGKMTMPSSENAVAEFIEFIASRSPFSLEIQAAAGIIKQEMVDALQRYREGQDYVMPTATHLIQAKVV